MPRAKKTVAFLVAWVALAYTAAAADHAVVGKRTYMHSFPFFGC